MPWFSSAAFSYGTFYFSAFDRMRLHHTSSSFSIFLPVCLAFCLMVHLFINSYSWYSVAVWTNRSFKLSDSGKKVTIYNNSLKNFCLLLVLNLTYCHTEYLASFLQWFHPLQSDSSALFCSEQSRTGIQHHIDMLQTQAAVGRGKALVSLDYSYLRYLKIWRKTLLKILLRVVSNIRDFKIQRRDGNENVKKTNRFN